MDQFGEALDTNDFSQYSGYSIGGNNVMDELFESVSMLSPVESHRCRTISTSSISSAFAGYNSCEIFPEIADIMVVSSGGGDYDIRDQLTSGKDYIRVEDIESSQPNQAQQPNANGPYDASTMEMLVTLGFKSRDLTSSHDLWPEINLCWASGKADNSVRNKLSAAEGGEASNAGNSAMKMEFCDLNNEPNEASFGVEVVPDELCMEGIAALDVTSLLEQFEEAESKANLRESGGLEICQASSAVIGETFLNIDRSVSDVDILQSESSNGTEAVKEERVNPRIKCLEPIKIDYLKSCKLLEQNDAINCQSANSLNKGNLFSVEVGILSKKKRGRPPKTILSKEGVGRRRKLELETLSTVDNSDQNDKVDTKKLCRVLSNNEIQTESESNVVNSDYSDKSDVSKLGKLRPVMSDIEMQISEERKLQMMERARAISLKISKKVHEEKLENVCAAKCDKKDSYEKTSGETSSLPNDRMHLKSTVFKIPRLMKTKSESDIELKNACETVSKVIPPLLKESVGNKESIKGWPKLQTKNSCISEGGSIRKEIKVTSWTASAFPQRSALSQRIACTSVASSSPDKILTLDCGQPSEDGQQSSGNISIMSSSPSISVNSPNASQFTLVTEIVSTSNGLTLNSSDSLKCFAQVPSQELIDKIVSSTKRKSTILIPNAVPAHRERGHAIGIVLASATKSDCSSQMEKAGIANEVVVAMASENDSSDSNSTGTISSDVSTEGLQEVKTSARPVKRKLNLSQYKSILPERRKVLAPSSVQSNGLPATSRASKGTATLSVTYVYGNCLQVGLDHDYCRKEDAVESNPGNKEKTVISSGGESNDGCSGGGACGLSSSDMDLSSGDLSQLIDSSDQIRKCKGGASVDLTVNNNKLETVTTQYSLHGELTESRPSSGDNCSSLRLTSSQDSTPTVRACELHFTAKSASSSPSTGNLEPGSCVTERSQEAVPFEEKCSEVSESDTSGHSQSCIADANSWRKTTQRVHRNYRGHGQQLSAVERYPVKEPAAMLRVSQKMLKSIDTSSSMQMDISDTDSPQSETFKFTPSHIASSSACKMLVEQARRSQPAAVSSNSVIKRDSRSSSSDGSIGHSSRSSVCSSRGYQRRRNSYSDSSSSRSRSPVNRRRWSRSKYRSQRRYSHSRSRSRDYYRSRSPSPYQSRQWKRNRKPKTNTDWQSQEELRIMNEKVEEERRVVYVGRIPKDYTTGDLCRQLQCFGEITNCSVHIRKNGISGRSSYDSDHKDSQPDEDGETHLDHYGFVTFRSTAGAYAAIESGRTVPGCEGFDFSFGARRQFCKTGYSDLDGNKEIEEEYPRPDCSRACNSFSFDALLKQATQQIKKKR